MGDFNQNSLESLLERVNGMSNNDFIKELDYERPKYISGKTGEPLSNEAIEGANKLFTNLDLPVAAFKVGGLLPGMVIAKQSRATDDSRVVAARMIQANKNLGKAVKDLFLPDMINTIGIKFLESVWDEYGDDSVARNVYFGAIFEGISMLAAMSTFHHRTMFGIEKSTRYVDYSRRRADGKFNYIVDPLIREAGLEAVFRDSTDNLFGIYAKVMNPKNEEHKKIMEWLSKELPFEMYESKAKESLNRLGEKQATDEELRDGYNRTIAAAFKDQVRHLLPMSAKTTLGLAFNAEAMRHFVYKSQARYFGEGQMLMELFRREMTKVVDPLLNHTEPVVREELIEGEKIITGMRSKEYRDFLFNTRQPITKYAPCNIGEATEKRRDEQLRLNIERFNLNDRIIARIRDEKLALDLYLRLHGNLNDVAEAILREKNSPATMIDAMSEIKYKDRGEIIKMLYDYMGIAAKAENDLRKNRRHRPGRAFERMTLDLSMIMPIAEIRDIRRHTVPSYLDPMWFGPFHGFYTSPGLKVAGLEKEINAANEKATSLWHQTEEKEGPYAATLALPMSARAPMNDEMNLREAYHVFELRTAPGAAPVYLRLCQMAYGALRNLEPEIGKTFKFVNKETETDFGRAIQETRSIAKRKKNLVKVELA
ncbi:MAG TPA: FAD-dependent thymidylate synthase [Candidatus Nanoarchaeia archaeon]|nr:FAD-dependent thymidylate synthase [Candidatus Nanoarchaeia archaeon]